MKYFNILLILLLLSNNSLVHAQVSISGKISDTLNSPVIAATVALLSAADSALAKVDVTADDGTFRLQNVKPGNYIVKTSAVGYRKYNSAKIIVDGSADIQLPEIILHQVGINLKEVVVTAQKPLIEVKPDKTIFNVESSINATGSTAMELLQKAPGVVVDQNDNIMLKGRGGVQVQIDGKPVELSGTDLGDYLRSIQSSDIETIEFISNPSSKYDAEGTAGIINIKLKKNKNYGTNGSATLGYAISTFSKYNTSFNINHRSKNLNLFASYGNNWGNRINHLNIYREQNDSIYNQHSSMIFNGLRNNFKAGADYYLNSKNTIGVLVTGNLGNFEGNTNSQTDISGQTNGGEIAKVLLANTQMNGKRNNINFNANYHLSDTSGHDLTMDADYGFFNNHRNSYLPNIYTLPDEMTVISEKDYRTISPTDVDVYSLKSDYTQRLWKGKMGAGFKLSWVRTDNTYEFYNVIDQINYLADSLSNRFVYTENINAAYINYDRSFKKNLELQLGLRAEQTNSNGALTTINDVPNEDVRRHYINLFPSAGLTYNMNAKNSFTLSYSRRIDRPGYQELNPFQYRLDELSYRQGNPFLKPQYTDKFELSHTWDNSLNTSISYSYTTDFVAQVTDSAAGGSTFLTSENLAKERVVSLDMNYSKQVLKWWNIFVNGSLYNSYYFADFGEGKSIDFGETSYNFYAQNTFSLPMDISLELSGFYSSPSIWGGTYASASQWSMDAGVQKKLFKKQGSLKIAVSDIFHTSPWRSENKFGGFYVLSSGDWESRQLRITFSYRFGNNQLKTGRQHQTGSEDEMKRVGGGDQ